MTQQKEYAQRRVEEVTCRFGKFKTTFLVRFTAAKPQKDASAAIALLDINVDSFEDPEGIAVIRTDRVGILYSLWWQLDNDFNGLSKRVYEQWALG